MLTMLAMMTAVAAAGIAPPPPATTKPARVSRSVLPGRWTLDLDSMAIPAQARPASVSVTFTDNGDGTWQITYIIAARDGSERRMTSRERLDGKWAAIDGDRLEADSVAVTSPAPDTLVMGLAKDGRPGSVRVYSVLPGGRAMIESAVNVGDDGKPLIRTYRWSRRN